MIQRRTRLRLVDLRLYTSGNRAGDLATRLLFAAGDRGRCLGLVGAKHHGDGSQIFTVGRQSDRRTKPLLWRRGGTPANHRCLADHVGQQARRKIGYVRPKDAFAIGNGCRTLARFAVTVATLRLIVAWSVNAARSPRQFLQQIRMSIQQFEQKQR